MLHTDLPIYKKGYDLLSLAADVQLNMPRTFKQSLGKRVHDECVDLLLEIGYANASRGEKRCEHIRNVLRRRGHCIAGDITKTFRRKIA